MPLAAPDQERARLDGLPLATSSQKVYFLPSNCYPSLVLAIELQNRVSSTIQLSKPFTFGHPAVLLGGFADVDATWRWGPLVSATPTLSLFSVSLFLSSLISLLPSDGRAGNRNVTSESNNEEHLRVSFTFAFWLSFFTTYCPLYSIVHEFLTNGWA